MARAFAADASVMSKLPAPRSSFTSAADAALRDNSTTTTLVCGPWPLRMTLITTSTMRRAAKSEKEATGLRRYIFTLATVSDR